MTVEKGYYCPVCQKDGEIDMELSTVDVYMCSSCKHEFSDNIKQCNIYSEEYFQEKHKNFFAYPDTALYGKIAGIIRETKREDAGIIDIGCGTGNFLRFMKKEGFIDLSGIDLIENQHGEIKFIKGDFMEYAPNRGYDVVVTMMNIEHIKDVGAYMKKICGMLNKDGLLIVNTINKNSLIYRLARVLYRLKIKFAAERLYDTHHVNHFSEESLRKLFESGPLARLKGFAKNYSFRSLDLTFSGIRAALFKCVILLIFSVSSLFGDGISQTQVFVRK